MLYNQTTHQNLKSSNFGQIAKPLSRQKMEILPIKYQIQCCNKNSDCDNLSYCIKVWLFELFMPFSLSKYAGEKLHGNCQLTTVLNHDKKYFCF